MAPGLRPAACLARDAVRDKATLYLWYIHQVFADLHAREVGLRAFARRS